MTATDEPVKSAWTKGLKDAPRKRPILVRCPHWDCLALMECHADLDGGEEFWMFTEEVLSDAVGSLEEDELADAEWAEIPT